MNNQRITTQFGPQSTAADVIAGVDLTGRRAIVTGAASGIGVETARALAGANAEVTLAVRNLEAGARIAAAITASTGNERVLVAPLDLADQASIAALVAGWSGPLHLLVNNAGVSALPSLQLSSDGWEMQFATNHLGHFALALGLHEALASAGNARIVSLSSVGHRRSPVIFDDINFTARPYDPLIAYGQSKTANVLFAVEATRRWADDGITANAVHPGTVTATNLMRYIPAEVLADLRTSLMHTYKGAVEYKTIEQGAATSVLVATSPRLEGIGGRYFENCNEAAVVDPSTSGAFGVAAYALDADAAARLWQVSSDALSGSRATTKRGDRWGPLRLESTPTR
jgi:NAD(P)-dependent dehydrogenase (short-subunit alcohol dehydrogenase family)